MTTHLLNSEGEVCIDYNFPCLKILKHSFSPQEIALHERKQIQRSFHREFGYRGVEDFHHQQVNYYQFRTRMLSLTTLINFQGDPQAGEEKCRIM